jgi:hypothetical protein
MPCYEQQIYAYIYLYVSAGSIATRTTQGSVKQLKGFTDKNPGVYTPSFL